MVCQCCKLLLAEHRRCPSLLAPADHLRYQPLEVNVTGRNLEDVSKTQKEESEGGRQGERGEGEREGGKGRGQGERRERGESRD